MTRSAPMIDMLQLLNNAKRESMPSKRGKKKPKKLKFGASSPFKFSGRAFSAPSGGGGGGMSGMGGM